MEGATGLDLDRRELPSVRPQHRPCSRGRIRPLAGAQALDGFDNRVGLTSPGKIGIIPW